ncbi:MAG TPA: hypothetical protein VFO87_07205 [Nitrospira sp.]|nr:hypothetical protein [Nitrospira sp.]
MRLLSRIIVFCLLTAAAPAFAGNQIYRYKDDSGTLNFTTEWHSIPEKYRSEAMALAPEAPPPPHRQAPAIRVVTATADYRMGDHDTRMDATRMAIEVAKRQALEQVATYLESVTEVKNLDVTRDEIRTYTAGIVSVLNQQTRTRLEDGGVVIHVDLTAQVDQDEVILAINALRENERATHELASLRAETEQLRQRLDVANLALATASTAEQVHALTLQRQQLLNQMQADALVAQALTGYAYVTPARVQQINELLGRARQLHPSNPHLPSVERSMNERETASAPSALVPSLAPSAPSVSTPPGSQSPLAAPLPQSPLATPLPPSPLATPLPQSPLTIPLPQSPLATLLPPSPLAKPLGPSPLAAPLAPSPLAAPLR